jgi:hypothetical protein
MQKPDIVITAVLMSKRPMVIDTVLSVQWYIVQMFQAQDGLLSNGDVTLVFVFMPNVFS